MKTFEITLYTTVEYTVVVEAETREEAEEEANFSFAHLKQDISTVIDKHTWEIG